MKNSFSIFWMRGLRSAAMLTAVGVLGTFMGVPAHADQIGDMLRATADKLTPAIVSIRAINAVVDKRGGQTRNFDMTLDFKGVVVSPDGLVMCTNLYVTNAVFKRSASADQTVPEISITPEEIHVTVGNESTEYYGTVAASDSTLGLSFIQLRDLKGRTLPFVDLGAAAAGSVVPKIGDPTASVTRLVKNYDFAPIVIQDRVIGIIDKPRRAYVPEGLAGGMGLPVYSADGNIIGIATRFPPAERTEEDVYTEGMAQLVNDQLSTAHPQLIVPITNVAPLIALAMTRASALPPFVIPKPRPVAPAPSTAPLAPPLTPGVATPPAAAGSTATKPAAPAAK